MTACAMASDYGAELLLGTSPVLTSPFLNAASASCFSDYPRCGVSTGVGRIWDSSSQSNYYSKDSLVDQFSDLRTTDRFTDRNNYARTGSLRRSKKLDRLKKEFAAGVTPLLLTNPSKSCLRQIDEQVPQDECTLATSPSKEKKKVSFADALGKQLAQIKLIAERPDCPPFWSQDFFEKVTGGKPQESNANEWELTFPQPVSDYVNFKNKLDNNYVTLENVVIDNKYNKLVKGTISVRNIAFHKEVLIRYTSNSWATTEDCIALYVPAPIISSAYDLYDRFSFEFPLPNICDSDKVEFCIRFSCDGKDYWDNNSNKNYTIVSFRCKNKKNRRSYKSDDEYRMQLERSSEFGYWNVPSANDETPYW